MHRYTLLLLGMAAFLVVSPGCDCRTQAPRGDAAGSKSEGQSSPPPSHRPTEAQAELLARLLPDPRIVNTHEHLRETRGDGARLKLDAANARSGVTASGLVASSRYTFTLRKGTGFVDHHDNNEYLCRIAREHPGRYYAFVTFDPEEPDIVRKLEEYLGKGATGVKLYAGHGANTGDGRPFHVCPLDHPRLLPLYEYCQVHRVPIVYHINMRKYAKEAYRVLQRYPELPVIIPHFALWSGLLPKLDRLLDTYPNVMTDISFGWWYSVPGLKRISNAAPGRILKKGQIPFRDFMIKHQDRIMFGTDVVVTEAGSKSADALADFWLSYRCMLELEEYDFTDRKGEVHHFRGLSLPEEVLRKIYRENWLRLLERCGRGEPAGATAAAGVSGG